MRPITSQARRGPGQGLYHRGPTDFRTPTHLSERVRSGIRESREKDTDLVPGTQARPRRPSDQRNGGSEMGQLMRGHSHSGSFSTVAHSSIDHDRGMKTAAPASWHLAALKLGLFSDQAGKIGDSYLRC